MIVNNEVDGYIKIVKGTRSITAHNHDSEDSTEFVIESSRTGRSQTIFLSNEFVDMFAELIDEIQK